MNIIQMESASFYKSRKGYIPDIIACHQTGGDTPEPAINTFMNPKCKVSAHFLISKTGDVWQFVKLTDGSFCNGTSSNVLDKKYYKHATNPIVKSRPYNANFYTTTIEFVMSGNGVLTLPQYKTGLEVMELIINETEEIYNREFIVDRLHIIGHDEITPKTRSGDPGKNFPFDKYIKDLGGKVKIEDKPIDTLQVGDTVNYRGLIYLDSYGQINKGVKVGRGIITRIIEDRNAGYLIQGNNSGWFEKASLEEVI